MNVRIVIGMYKTFQIILIDGGHGFNCDLFRPENRIPYTPVCKDVKLTTNERYVHGGNNDNDFGC